MEPPNWEHECAEAELPASAALWRERYEPVRERYEAERAVHGSYPDGFLDTLRHLLACMEQNGAFAEAPDIRLLETEVDADTTTEEAALTIACPAHAIAANCAIASARSSGWR